MAEMVAVRLVNVVDASEEWSASDATLSCRAQTISLEDVAG